VDAVEDGRTGALVPAGNWAALAGAIAAYLRDPERSRRHGKAGRARVLRDFRPEQVWSELEREYRPAGAPAISRERPPAGRAAELLVKRLVDIAGAAAGLTVTAPLLGMAALGTWITLGRPILFRQVRPGRAGRPFTLLKIRTMRAGPGSDAERVTRLGRFLRHFSLDELPQLWNVLRGDMSLVGPRPLLMDYLELYSPREARRHDVRPGLTGWCQVNGRNSLAWDRKFELDVWYVEHWSLFLDFKILVKTLARVVHRSGIEGPGNRCWPGFLGGGPVLPGTETDPYGGGSR
jgi:lipopolysaccharide/colanic/teichoic acid biosynthesis glycosyltransferase